jgi:hypothetical protein
MRQVLFKCPPKPRGRANPRPGSAAAGVGGLTCRSDIGGARFVIYSAA